MASSSRLWMRWNKQRWRLCGRRNFWRRFCVVEAVRGCCRRTSLLCLVMILAFPHSFSLRYVCRWVACCCWRPAWPSPPRPRNTAPPPASAAAAATTASRMQQLVLPKTTLEGLAMFAPRERSVHGAGRAALRHPGPQPELLFRRGRPLRQQPRHRRLLGLRRDGGRRIQNCLHPASSFPSISSPPSSTARPTGTGFPRLFRCAIFLLSRRKPAFSRASSTR